MQDKFIKVVVTDADGDDFEAETMTAVGVDASSDVSIIDTYGLQSDGTGIIGDVLRLSYGADFGTVTTVSWYRNGSVIKTTGSGNDGIPERDGGLMLEVSAERGTGTYKATVVADGEKYETNEIVITDKEEAATITSFTLEDDYTDGLDVHYNTTDKRVVATVTMSKNYDGKFSVYRATDTSFKSALATDALTTSTAAADMTASDAIKAAAAVDDQESVLTTNAATNYQVLTANAIGSGYGYINPDGTVVYKWVLNDTGVTRGADYVVAFDQDSISSDKPGTGIANTSDKATAPYITAPASIAVTKVAAGVKPEITFEDENGDALGWFGYQEGTAQSREPNGIATSTKTTLANVSASSSQIYAATNKTNDPKGSGVSALVSTVTNRNGDPIDKGVWTAQAAAGTEAYFFATVKFAKGIFGANALELTSEAVATAQPAATDMSILEDKTTATSAVVSFANLRADGTVYVARGRFLGNGAAAAPASGQIDTVAEIVEAFNPDDATTYVGKAAVDAGAKSVTIDNVIGSYTGAHTAAIPQATAYIVDGNTGNANGGLDVYASGTTYGTDDYVAIFVPNDTDNYGQISTNAVYSKDSYTLNEDTKTFNTLRVNSIPTSISYDKKTRGTIATVVSEDPETTTITSATLIAKDQFGNTVRNAVTSEQKVTSVTANDSALSTTRERGEGVYTVTDNGQATVVLKTPDGAVIADKGDGYTISILGSNITLKALAEVTNHAHDADASKLLWDVKFGSDNLIDNDDVVTLAGLTLTQAVVTGTPNNTLTITVSGTAGTVTATVAGTPNNEPEVSSTVNGRVITLSPHATYNEAATVTVTITLNNNTRTVTYDATTGGGSWTPALLTVDSDVLA